MALGASFALGTGQRRAARHAQGGIGGGFNPVDENTPAGSVVAYVGTDDIPGSLKKAESLGAKTLMPKTEIPGVGWFGIFMDPTGNRVGLYTSMNPQ